MADRAADEAEIIALIHRNRIAVWMRDFDAWADCFVHAPYLTRMGWWRQGGVFHRQGWEEISSRLRQEMIELPQPSPKLAHETTVENLTLRVSGDMAWATFHQRYPGDPPAHYLQLQPVPGLSYEFRAFERHGGKWKIAVLGLLDTGIGLAQRPAIQLDPEGRVLRMSPAAEIALADDDDLVVRNGRLRFRDSRTDRKLREAVRWAAGVDTGYMPTSGSVPIVMEGGEDLPTRIWWVVANAATVHFWFADPEPGGRRLDVAAMVYGLSPAQKQLAALVAEGLSLAAIADRMGITANTARTHLQRVFDKTGVRTQPALVRVLLSTASPI